MIGVFSHILLESVNLTNAFTYYHGEPERKGFNPKSTRGGWDEELYDKDIDSCIRNTLDSRYVKGKDKFILHLYTMGEEYSSIYLGSVNVKVSGDKKFDWEWNEQEPITQEQISYLRDEVQHEAATKRSNLKDSQFGLPKERKYPLDTKEHVLSAIKFFNYVDKDKEKELAKNLNDAINTFFDDGEKLDIHVGKNNRFSKYFEKSSFTEAARINDKGETVPKVCPKCGAKVILVFKGEPVWCCSNEKCKKYFGVKPFKENANSHIYYNKNNISEDDESMMLEGYIKNQPDIYYNKDKFDSGEINLCFITGLSGSGKSTMGRNMANDKIEHYELDDVIWNKESFTMENFKEYGDLIYSFFKGIGKKYYCTTEECTDGRFENYNYEKELINTFINYAIKYAKSHKNTKFVIEGVWIYFYVEPELLKDYAVYIKGTSMLISKIRAAKRDTANDHKDNNKIKNSLIAFKSVAFKRWEEYLEGEKYIKKYRDYFTNLMNKTVEESAMFNNDDIPDIPFLCSYNISGLAIDILNELSGPDVDDAGTDTGEEENFDMPADGGEGGETPEPANTETDDTGTEDNNDDENYDVNDDTEGDDTGEEDNGENNEEENPEGGEEDENFDLPEDGEGEVDTTGGEDEGLDNGNNDTAMDGGLDQTKSKLQEIEDQIFDDLTDVDKANKTQELKKLFMDLHANCTNIIEMVDDMPKNEDMLKITEFINKSLEDTKQYILDYISNTFDSKSYMENMAEFQKYIAVLYSIRNVLDELKPNTSK